MVDPAPASDRPARRPPVRKTTVITNRIRVHSIARKAMILDAARRVFSNSGYDAARTRDIARLAGISEAMVYRHFSSKDVLYRAVLRKTIREQNESYALLRMSELDGRTLVRTLRFYFELATSEQETPIKEGFRLLIASMAGDGSFASLVYRRAHRMMHASIARALDNARLCGDIVGKALATRNTSMFIEHVGTAVNAIAMSPAMRETLVYPYAGDRETLVREAVWFCCRGVGFTDAAIARHYDA
jgi:AcrR family transcriptional regulator